MLDALVSTTQQYYQRWPVPCEVNAVTGAEICPPFHHPFAHAPHIPQVSSLDSGYDPIDSALYRGTQLGQT